MPNLGSRRDWGTPSETSLPTPVPSCPLCVLTARTPPRFAHPLHPWLWFGGVLTLHWSRRCWGQAVQTGSVPGPGGSPGRPAPEVWQGLSHGPGGQGGGSHSWQQGHGQDRCRYGEPGGVWHSLPFCFFPITLPMSPPSSCLLWGTHGCCLHWAGAGGLVAGGCSTGGCVCPCGPWGEGGAPL